MCKMSLSVFLFFLQIHFFLKKKQITFFLLPLHAKIGNMPFFCVPGDAAPLADLARNLVKRTY